MKQGHAKEQEVLPPSPTFELSALSETLVERLALADWECQQANAVQMQDELVKVLLLSRIENAFSTEPREDRLEFLMSRERSKDLVIAG